MGITKMFQEKNCVFIMYKHFNLIKLKTRMTFFPTILKFPDMGQLYLMLSSVSSGIGATVWTAGKFLLVAPLTKFDEEVAATAASGAPVG